MISGVYMFYIPPNFNTLRILILAKEKLKLDKKQKLILVIKKVIIVNGNGRY